MGGQYTVASVTAEAATRARGAAKLSLAFNVLQTAAKFVAAALTGSVSMLSEAIHSGADVFSSALAYVGLRAGGEPPDDEHPYGHGKIESLASFGEALLLVFTMFFVLYQAGKHFIHPEPVDNLDAGIYLMCATTLLGAIIGRHVKSCGEKARSLSMISNGQHLLVDCVTSLAVLLALLIERITGWQQADPAIAVVLALWIGFSAYGLGRQAVNQLIDRRLPSSEIRLIKELVSRDPRILSYHRLRTRLSGSTRQVDVHIVVPADVSVVEAHSIADDLEERIRGQLSPAEVVVHVDPLDPTVQDLS